MANPEGRSYTDYSIRIEGGLEPGFEANLANGPKYEILSVETHSSTNPEHEMLNQEPRPIAEEKAWEEDLSELVGLVKQTREAYIEGNSIALEGFKRILEESRSSSLRFRSDYRNSDRFPEEVIELFEKDCNGYSSDDRAPLRRSKNGKIITHRPKGRFFTVRQMRFLIKSRGLNGKVITPREIGKSEGYKDYSAVQQVIKNAQSNIGLALAPYRRA